MNLLLVGMVLHSGTATTRISEADTLGNRLECRFGATLTPPGAQVKKKCEMMVPGVTGWAFGEKLTLARLFSCSHAKIIQIVEANRRGLRSNLHRQQVIAEGRVPRVARLMSLAVRFEQLLRQRVVA